jgi:hypothetical protein
MARISPSPRLLCWQNENRKKAKQIKIRYTRTARHTRRQMLPHFDEANENCYGLKALLLQSSSFFRQRPLLTPSKALEAKMSSSH